MDDCKDFFLYLQILTDNIVYIELLQSEEENNIALRWTTQHILSLGNNFLYCYLHKVSRQRVHKAHDLADVFRQSFKDGV